MVQTKALDAVDLIKPNRGVSTCLIRFEPKRLRQIIINHPDIAPYRFKKKQLVARPDILRRDEQELQRKLQDALRRGK